MSKLVGSLSFMCVPNESTETLFKDMSQIKRMKGEKLVECGPYNAFNQIFSWLANLQI